MLILSRKLGESLMIGDDIKITILEVCGKRVSVGIEAPLSIEVYRTEIYEKNQQRKSAKQSGISKGNLKNEENTAKGETETQK